MKANQLIKLCLVSALLVLLNNVTLSSQQMEATSRWKIVEGKELLDYREIGNKFAFDPDVKVTYNQSILSFRRAKTAGWFSLGSLVLGATLLSINSSSNSSSVAPVTGYGIGLLIFLVPITGIGALVSLNKGKTRQRKVIDAYNQKVSGLHKEKVIYELDFGVTQNGVGFVYKF